MHHQIRSAQGKENRDVAQVTHPAEDQSSPETSKEPVDTQCEPWRRWKQGAPAIWGIVRRQRHISVEWLSLAFGIEFAPDRGIVGVLRDRWPTRFGFHLGNYLFLFSLCAQPVQLAIFRHICVASDWWYPESAFHNPNLISYIQSYDSRVWVGRELRHRD